VPTTQRDDRTAAQLAIALSSIGPRNYRLSNRRQNTALCMALIRSGDLLRCRAQAVGVAFGCVRGLLAGVAGCRLAWWSLIGAIGEPGTAG